LKYGDAGLSNRVSFDIGRFLLLGCRYEIGERRLDAGKLGVPGGVAVLLGSSCGFMRVCAVALGVGEPIFQRASHGTAIVFVGVGLVCMVVPF